MTERGVVNLQMRAFELVECAERFLPKLEETMTSLKPINLTCLLLDIFMARTMRQSAIAVTRLLELYEIFWTIPAILLDAFKVFFGFLIKTSVRCFHDFQSFLHSFVKREDSEYSEEEFMSRVSEKDFATAMSHQANDEPEPRGDFLSDISHKERKIHPHNSMDEWKFDPIYVEQLRNQERSSENYFSALSAKLGATVTTVKDLAGNIAPTVRVAAYNIADGCSNIPGYISRFTETLIEFVTQFMTYLRADNGILNTILTSLKNMCQTSSVTFGWIVALITMVGCGGSLALGELPNKIAKIVTNLGNSVRGATSIGKGLTDLSATVTNATCSALGIQPPLIGEKAIMADKAIKCADLAKDLLKQIEKDPTEAITNPDFFKQLDESIASVDALYKEMAQMKAGCPMLTTLILEIKSNTQAIKEFTRKVANSIVGKQVPVTLYIYGGSGAGKSALTKQIAKLLSVAKERPLTTWTRNPGDKYFSGYVGQEIVVYDDFNANKTSEDHGELDQIYTTNSFMPNMASLPDKGVRFTSKYLIICSNMPFVTNSDVLRLPSILDRRRDYMFQVRNKALEKLHKGFNEEGKAFSKEQEKACYKADYSHLELTQMCVYRSKEDTATPLAEDQQMKTIEEVVQAMIMECDERRWEFEAHVRDIAADFSTLRGTIFNEIKQRMSEAYQTVSALRRQDVKIAQDTLSELSSLHSSVSEVFEQVPLDETEKEDRRTAFQKRTDARLDARAAYGLPRKPIIYDYVLPDCETRLVYSLLEQDFTENLKFDAAVDMYLDHRLVLPLDHPEVIARDFLRGRFEGLKVERLDFGLTAEPIFDLTEFTEEQRTALFRKEFDLSGRIAWHSAIGSYVRIAAGLQFQSFDVDRIKPILLMGPPGIGKSCLTKGVEQVIDEFPNDPELFKRAVEKVWAAYENPKDYCVLTCNATSLDRAFTTVFPGDTDRKAAFLRRCNVVRLSWRRNYLRCFKQSDLSSKPYDEVVRMTITYDDGKTADLTEAVVRDMVKKGIAQIDTCRYAKPLQERNETCELEVVVEITSQEVADPTFRIGVTGLIRKIKPVRGSLTKYLPYLYKVSGIFAKKVGNIDTCLSTLNTLINEPIDGSVGVTFADRKRYILVNNEKGIAEFYTSGELPREPNLSDEAYDQLLKEQLKLSNPLAYVINTCVDAVMMLVKTGIAIHAVSGYHSQKTEDNRNFKIVQNTKKFKHEGWGDEMEELARFMGDDSFAKPIPKSRLATVQRDVYCSTHRQVNCSCLHYESRRPVIPFYHEQRKDTMKINHDFVLPESLDLEVLRKKPVPVVIEESLDLEVLRKKPVPIVVEECTNCTACVDWPKQVSRSSDKPAYVESMNHEAMEDQQARDVLALLRDNTLMVLTDNDQINCRAIMLRDRIGVTNSHSACNDTLRVEDIGMKIWTATVIYRNVKKDVVFFALPPQAPSFKNIVKHFVKEEQLSTLQGNELILQTTTKRKDVITSVWRVLVFGDVVERRIKEVAKHGINYRGHAMGLKYEPVNTSGGDCGSPLVITNPTITRKIVGFHSAGSDSEGFGSIVTQEFIEKTCADFFHESLDEITVLSHQCVKRHTNATYGGFPLFGTLQDGEKVLNQFHPTETKYYKSPFAFPEKFGHQFEPAVLSDVDPRKTGETKIYDEAIQKWNVVQPDIDVDLLRMCADEIGDYLATQIQASNLKVTTLTKTEAINGVSYLVGSNPMYRQSSAGYPFKHWTGVQRKSVFFEQDDKGLQVLKKDELGTRLNHAVDALISTARHEKRSAVVFCGSLKDEPLKLKKIYETSKTRSFAACPVDYTIAHRMYFHGAGAAITSIFHKTPIKIGINPASLDWHSLYYYHAEVSDVGFDGDFANWDATIPKLFMEMVPLIYNKIYKIVDTKWTKEDDVIRTWLHKCLQGPLITYDNYVVKVPGGNPSGQPETALDNCLVNMMLTYYCYYKIMAVHKPEFRSFEKFMEFVRCSFFGDDNMITVKAEILHIFNFNSYKEECQKIGFTLTNAAKTGDVAPFMELKDMEFLKRNFVEIEGKYYGALVDLSICKMLSYATKKKTHKYSQEPERIGFDKTTIASTVQGALRESCLKGKDFFDEIRDHLRASAYKFNLRGIDFPSFHSCLSATVYNAPLINL